MVLCNLHKPVAATKGALPVLRSDNLGRRVSRCTIAEIEWMLSMVHEILHPSLRCIQGCMSSPFLPQGMVSPAARSSAELTPAERYALQQRHAQQQASFQVRTFLKNTGYEARRALSCQRRVAGVFASITAKHVSAFRYLAACRLAGANHQCHV